MSSAVMPTYARADVAFERGEGPYLYATDGRRFLDFGGGIAVVALGHCHPHLSEAIATQARTLMHTSNLFEIPGQTRLAERITQNSFADLVFFTNSGAEANEGVLKLARRYHHVNGNPERWRIITFEGAFHGRTLATIAAGGGAKLLDGFGPKVEGFDQVPFADLDAVEAAITAETAAVHVEPILGEGGIVPLPDGFLNGLRRLCDKHGILLTLDEVQTGIARTGRFLAHEWDADSRPDAAALGKGIGGGFPMGAFIATAEAAKGMVPGTHGSTYGGNPLAMAAGNAVMDVVLEDGFMAHVEEMGTLLRGRLDEISRRNDSFIEEVRGKGLMLGIKCSAPNGDVVNALRAKGLLSVPAGDNAVRLLPPLTITAEHVEEAAGIIEDVCRELNQG